MIRIGSPATTIDTPLEHLSACHRRIEDRLATLRRAADHWGQSPSEALEAIRKSLKFLDSNGALHTMDEEASLFPRLRPRLTHEESAHLDRLEQQHHEVESVMAELKGVVAELVALPQQATPLQPRYRELVTQLEDLYGPHIQFEDQVIMRLAGRVLSRGDLEDISREMRARRTEMDELARRVVHVFAEMGRESLDLHILFEAGGNEPASRNRVLDAVNRAARHRPFGVAGQRLLFTHRERQKYGRLGQACDWIFLKAPASISSSSGVKCRSASRKS